MTEQPKTTFTDNTGKEYSLKLTLGHLRNSEDWLGIDLVKDQEDALKQIYEDFSLLVIAAVELTRDQRQDEISDEDFVNHLSGEVLDEVSEAFLNSWALCLPKLRRGALLATNQRVSQEIEKAASMISSEILTSPKLSKMIQENITKSFGE